MSLLNFGVSCLFLHFSTVLPSSLYLDEFSKVFTKLSLKVLMFSKDFLSFIVL
jgi:hypothetical protein